MFAEAPDLDHAAIRRVVADAWGIAVTSLTYEPVGFGTHHYNATDEQGSRWFVNVDDLPAKTWYGTDADSAYDALDRAFRTTAALHRHGLRFVHAPRERESGDVITRLSDRYAVSVFAFIDGTSNTFGEFEDAADRIAVMRILGQLHAATSAVPEGLPRTDDLSVPQRDAFFASLDELDTTWDTGPFAEPARAVLIERRSAIVDTFDRYDELAAKVRRTGWVVTHGEPHAANVMRDRDGNSILIDWDTCGVSPRERDVWQVGPLTDASLAVYVDAGGTNDLDPAALELYRMWWSLAELTGYTDTFRKPHVDDANTATAWHWFQHYVP